MNSRVQLGDPVSGQALVARPDGRFGLEAVHTAPLSDTNVAVETLWSGVSFGTEFAVLRGTLDWGPFPMVTGYMAIGRATHVGSAVNAIAPGDVLYYRGNTSLEVATTGEKLTCGSGAHASVAVFDPTGNHGAEILPSGVPYDVGSMYVLPAVGLNGVNKARVGMGASVVVIGAGLIGLAVIAAAAARGARVVAVDVRPEALPIATALGAYSVVDASSGDVADQVHEIVGSDGADFVFESTGTKGPIDLAISLCRPEGCFVWQGNYGNGPVTFTFLAAHSRRLRMEFPCDDGYRPARRAVMSAIANGWLDWGRTITDRVEATDAPDFYGRIYRSGLGGTLGATVHWAD